MWGESAKQDYFIPSIESTDKKEIASNTEDAIAVPPKKYGIFRQISQKKEQTILNFPALFSITMILVTMVQLFVQIFDVLTDSMISNHRFMFSLLKLCIFELANFGKRTSLWKPLFPTPSYLPRALLNGSRSVSILISNANKVTSEICSKKYSQNYDGKWKNKLKIGMKHVQT